VRGFVTERHFAIAERVFPGIRDFYRALTEKPATFLELVWAFERRDCCEARAEWHTGASAPRQTK
jgi:hypothetical protein